ncbi:MAG: alpha-E domain-containing protein, partial [Acidobacteriota bacterium]
MLLSRVADALYWITRYLERAEHSARLIDVAVDLGLGRTSSDGAIDRLHASLGLPVAVSEGQVASFAAAAMFDLEHPNSVIGCITSARE